VAFPLVKSLIEQEYDNFEIFVVADQCEKRDWDIQDKKLKIFYPEEKLNAKLKSIQYAIERFDRFFDNIIIFDPDNLAPRDFLEKINDFHQAGFEAVQCRRSAKNLDTVIACLDAAGEYYHNFVERIMPYLLGSSATIAGSGMSVKTQIFRDFLNSPEVTEKIDGVILGEDKMLQNFIVSSNKRISFQDKAILFDEKVTENQQVQKQRTRWINAYFQNIRAALKLLGSGLSRASINQLIFGINTIYPPLFLLVLGAMMMTILNVALTGFSWPLYMLVSGIIMFALNFILALVLLKAPEKVLRSILLVPVFMYNQVLSLLNIRKSRNDFLVTEKTKVMDIKDVEK
jgi:cellulose synthase/poly-beta-1,6-N-acetylglucosamine synthase-like glycosyltransferase